MGMKMKKHIMAKLGMMACLAVGLVLTPVGQLKVQAAEVMATVNGTILSGTTSELLLLSTKEGKMEIKLDSGTDTSACKILLPDKQIYVSVSQGSDEYLHAVKITSDSETITTNLDSSTTATVTGTIGEKTKDDVLYVNTPQGEMEIKLDPTTNMSGCSVLVMNQKYSITCARGNDAYMHAISISDASGSSASTSASSSLTPAGSNASAATGTVSGTVSSNTKSDILYLSTKDGEMQFKIDNNGDTSKGMINTPGNKLTVGYYHGSDGYLHAVSVTGVKDAYSAATIDTSSSATVTGKVLEKSDENILYLEINNGTMELKLDAVTSVTGCKVLVKDQKITVTCARGSDAYMHALTITA